MALTAPSLPGVITVPTGLNPDTALDRLPAAATEQGLETSRDDHVLAVPVDEAVTRAAPLVALDVPLRVLVWSGADGRTWVSFHDPGWSGERHALPPELVDSLRVAATLVGTAGIA